MERTYDIGIKESIDELSDYANMGMNRFREIHSRNVDFSVKMIKNSLEKKLGEEQKELVIKDLKNRKSKINKKNLLKITVGVGIIYLGAFGIDYINDLQVNLGEAEYVLKSLSGLVSFGGFFYNVYTILNGIAQNSNYNQMLDRLERNK